MASLMVGYIGYIKDVIPTYAVESSYDAVNERCYRTDFESGSDDFQDKMLSHLWRHDT